MTNCFIASEPDADDRSGGLGPIQDGRDEVPGRAEGVGGREVPLNGGRRSNNTQNIEILDKSVPL